jgi:hypothetical protein
MGRLLGPSSISKVMAKVLATLLSPAAPFGNATPHGEPTGGRFARWWHHSGLVIETGCRRERVVRPMALCKAAIKETIWDRYQPGRNYRLVWDWAMRAPKLFSPGQWATATNCHTRSRSVVVMLP